MWTEIAEHLARLDDVQERRRRGWLRRGDRHRRGDRDGRARTDARLIVVRDRGVLDFPPAEVADRWLQALRRATGATGRKSRGR